MAKPKRTINALLKDAFAAKHVASAVRHFQAMVEEFQKSQWDDSASKGGKFIEAVLKALWVFVGETPSAGKDFKAGKIITQLGQKPGTAAHPDTIRITIPRACQFAYEIASNRGARHDADEIDANEMDASTVLRVCAWILSEMVRVSQKGLDLAQAKVIVEGLMQRRYPFTEDIDGRIYTDIAKSAHEAALLILWHVYPTRMSNTELIASLVRHDYTDNNAKVTVSRLTRYVDSDGIGNLRLRNTGLRRADALIAKASLES
jgi:hypothetical protein